METNNIIKEFNSAMLTAAQEKAKELDGAKDIKLYRFDFDSRKKVPVDPNNISSVEIEYYWIEYKKGEHLMKLSLFFKDVDTGTHNVHVIPGLFEEYEYRYEDKFPEEMPYAVVENGKAVIKNIQGKYEDEAKTFPSFAEPCGSGWWCPTSEYKCIQTSHYKILRDSNKTIAIDNFEYFFEKFRKFEFNSASEIFKFLKSANDVPNIEASSVRTEKYQPVCWYNITGTSCSIYLTKPIYFSGYGFFTQYNCVNFGKDVKDIVTNCQVVDENTKEFKAPSLLDKPDPETVKEALKRFMDGKID